VSKFEAIPAAHHHDVCRRAGSRIALRIAATQAGLLMATTHLDSHHLGTIETILAHPHQRNHHAGVAACVVTDR
jgi:hypothetical protein